MHGSERPLCLARGTRGENKTDCDGGRERPLCLARGTRGGNTTDRDGGSERPLCLARGTRGGNTTDRDGGHEWVVRGRVFPSGPQPFQLSVVMADTWAPRREGMVVC